MAREQGPRGRHRPGPPPPPGAADEGGSAEEATWALDHGLPASAGIRVRDRFSWPPSVLGPRILTHGQPNMGAIYLGNRSWPARLAKPQRCHVGHCSVRARRTTADPALGVRSAPGPWQTLRWGAEHPGETGCPRLWMRVVGGLYGAPALHRECREAPERPRGKDEASGRPHRLQGVALSSELKALRGAGVGCQPSEVQRRKLGGRAQLEETSREVTSEQGLGKRPGGPGRGEGGPPRAVSWQRRLPRGRLFISLTRRLRRQGTVALAVQSPHPRPSLWGAPRSVGDIGSRSCGRFLRAN